MNKPERIRSLSSLNESHWHKIKSPLGNEEYIPKLIDINPNEIKQKNNLWRFIKYFLIIFLLLLILLSSILIPIIIFQKQSSIITNISTRRTTTITTPISCIYPYVLNSNGRCVNIMIDSNNCGSIGYQCPSNSSCSAGICTNVPGIQLNNSISIWSSPINGSADDQMFNVTLPWNITLYNTTTNRVVVTTDGVLCFGVCSTSYTETTLPANAFVGVTVFPFWDDLYIYRNTSQGIYYESEGNIPNRKLIFEFYMSHYLEADQFYHFQSVFFENYPGIVQFIYFEATDAGDTCTIGVQASKNGPYLLYSYDRLNSVQNNLVLTFDTNRGTFNQSINN